MGIFFSPALANECAKNYCIENFDYDKEDDDMADDEDDDEFFCYDSSDKGECDDDNAYNQVWVERRAIEDASRNFHR